MQTTKLITIAGLISCACISVNAFDNSYEIDDEDSAVITAAADNSSTNTQHVINLIQYNVKASSGGWRNNSQDRVLSKQIAMLEQQIQATKNGVDFITLEEATDDSNHKKPSPLLSELLNGKGLGSWKTVSSLSSIDATQLSYNAAKWECLALVNNQETIPNFEPEWIKARAYNMAYCQLKNNKNFKILIVINHIPHLGAQERPFNEWKSDAFYADAAKLTKTPFSKLSQIKIIFAGDFNELGDAATTTYKNEYTSLFAPFVSKNHPMYLSENIQTCCFNSNWKYNFDHVVTNLAIVKPIETKIINPNNYPLITTTTIQNNEEHKAIIATITFSSN